MRRLLLAAIIAALTAVAPAQAATPFNVGSGDDPDVVVDPAGAGHFAWIDGETVRYCRVPRGATACSAAAALALPAHGAADIQGPVRVVRPASNRIVVLAQVVGGANPGVWAYNSTNNGTSFPNPPIKIGTMALASGQFGGRLASGPGTAFVSNATLCCGNSPSYQRMNLNGPASTVIASFPVGFLPDTDVVTGLAGNTPITAYTDGATVFYRQYLNSPAAPSANPDTGENVTAKWSAALVAASGEAPRLAGAPGAGLVLGFVSGDHLLATKWNGSGFPFAVEISNPAKAKVLQPSVYVEPGSGLFAATWRDDAYGETELRYSSSANGSTWTPSVPIARGGDRKSVV